MLLYALPDASKRGWHVQAQCESGFTIMESLTTAGALEFEPFGFRTASQPQLD